MFGLRAAFPTIADGRVNVHLGCGPIDDPEFINVDAIGFGHVHYLATVHPLPMFKNDTVDLIYVSHCLEHLDIVDVPKALEEWCRVIKPGGTLRLAVPDFEAILRIYESSRRSIRSIQYILYGGQDYPFNFHKAAFDRAHLSGLMNEAGFTEVITWEPGQDQWCKLNDCSSTTVMIDGTTFPVSLNLQAKKRVAPESAAPH